MMERLTSKEFSDRRWRMREAVRSGAAANWKDFDDGLVDFESRAFAYQYELIGQMVEAGTLDYPLVRDFLQYAVVADWNAFQPLEAHLVGRYGGRPSPWARFHRLAKRVTTNLQGPEVLG